MAHPFRVAYWTFVEDMQACPWMRVDSTHVTILFNRVLQAVPHTCVARAVCWAVPCVCWAARSGADSWACTHWRARDALGCRTASAPSTPASSNSCVCCRCVCRRRQGTGAVLAAVRRAVHGHFQTRAAKHDMSPEYLMVTWLCALAALTPPSELDDKAAAAAGAPTSLTEQEKQRSLAAVVTEAAVERWLAMGPATGAGELGRARFAVNSSIKGLQTSVLGERPCVCMCGEAARAGWWWRLLLRAGTQWRGAQASCQRECSPCWARCSCLCRRRRCRCCRRCPSTHRSQGAA
jgi:hypothetical protein